MKQFLFTCIFVLQVLSGFSQELNCQVSVINLPALQVGPVEKEIFKELENSIYDFMNTTKWTNDVSLPVAGTPFPI